MTRVYYRYIDEFYRIFADKITRVVLEKVNQKKAFFKRNTPVEKLSPELLKNMKGILQEGVIFASNKRKWIKKNIGFLFTWWKIHLAR